MHLEPRSQSSNTLASWHKFHFPLTILLLQILNQRLIYVFLNVSLCRVKDGDVMLPFHRLTLSPVRTICWTKCPLLSVDTLTLWPNIRWLYLHKFIWGSPFCSIGLHVWFHATTMLSVPPGLSYNLKSMYCEILPVIFSLAPTKIITNVDKMSYKFHARY